MNWQRRDGPILYAQTVGQSWCSVVLYNPCVLRVGHIYKMWFLGNASTSRAVDHCLGYAESKDGIYWVPYERNPIATPDDIPWGKNWQTPCVLFDEDENIYKMWFVSTTTFEKEDDGKGDYKCLEMNQELGYAVSHDGIHWGVHPEPIYPSGRGPSVTKVGPNRYRMWMCSRPSPEDRWDELYKNIYEFSSSDGINWTRREKPAIRPDGIITTCVYPCVIRDGSRYVMWYGGHVEGGMFEIFCSASEDGSVWHTRHDTPTFGASRDKSGFDGRYVSTPCVLNEGGRYLLYYSGRPLDDEYTGVDGAVHIDRSGIYNAIGIAVCPCK